MGWSPRSERTLALLAKSYYWPKMEKEVEAYVKSCMVCQFEKTERRKEAGLLQPLPTPVRPWQSASMDFISGFPSANGCKSIMVIVDRFSKYAVFMVAPGAYPAETTSKLLSLIHI